MVQPDLASSVGRNVRMWRSHIGLTRKQLAAAAGVSERYLNELENGSSNPSIGVIAKVAEALGRAPSEMLTNNGIDAARSPITTELLSVIGAMSASEQTAAAGALATWLAEQRRASKGIALLGLRGAGKSTLGKMLAARFSVPLVSVTREIERRAGMSLNEIFNLGGPDAYRSMENDVIAELTGRRGKIVLETAGGIAGNNDVLSSIFTHFKTVWLKASPEEHLARVAGQGDLRPMQGNPKALEHLRTLLAARETDYARAEITIDTSSRSVAQCFAELESVGATALVEGPALGSAHVGREQNAATASATASG